MSKNTPKEIKTYNNIEMSKNIYKIKNLNYNIDYNNMTKNIKLNVNILKALTTKIKNEDHKEKADNLIQLYASRKLSQKTQAEKQIIDFITYEQQKPRRQKTIDKKYDNLIEKYVDAKPLNVRMKDNKYIESIEINNENRAKTEVVFNIKKQGMDFDGLRIFLSLHNTIYKQLYEKCLNIVKKKKSVKIQTICEFQYKRNSPEEGKLNTSQFSVNPGIIVNYASSKIEEAAEQTLGDKLDKQKYNVDDKMDGSQDSRSISRINKIIVAIYTTRKERGSSYMPTPEKYSNSFCGLINIKNYDNECFKWCMKYHQSEKIKNCDRLSVLSKLEDKYNYDNVEFPTSYDDIKTFEENNKVGVIVYEIDDDNNIIREYPGNPDYLLNDRIYLLRVGDEDKSHYIYIKHIERLLNKNTHKSGVGKLMCPFCGKLQCCYEYDKHIRACHKKITAEGSLIKLPKKGSVMKFKNYKNMMRRPFTFICDLESTLLKKFIKKLKKKGIEANTQIIHEHRPNSCCYYFMCSFDRSRNELRVFEGEDCVKNMIIEMYKKNEKLLEEMRYNEKIKMSKEDTINFKTATCCSICKQSFNEGDIKCRDHCHRTGEYRGATHQKCNINYFCNRYTPVIFHNLRGYDSHFIIKQAYSILKEIGNPKIDAIPNSYEKFMSFNIGDLRFIDSFQFMASSLEKLVENLYSDDVNNKYKNFDNMKKYYSGEALDLLCRKGFYPYEWVDNDDKLNHVGLPERKEFYSMLSKEHISEDNYKHATNVYNKLNCETFRDYHLTYLKCDVLLLADVFENFRNTCISYYDLDPANYLTSPSLAWDAMLKMTNIELEQISDIKILNIIERQKRGGLCFVGSKRHIEANNEYLENYDDKKDSNYLMYWDANNLYGQAMSQPLPYKDIEFSNVDIDTVLNTSDDNETGYILEVDLHIPDEIHDKLKEYPPCPEIMTPTEDMFSDYQKELMKKHNIKANKNTTKLVPHLMDKKNYCIHYRNLKYVVELGLKITIVHNIISFKQKTWLKEYIDFNTEKRKHAKNEFEKDFFKLLNNAIYGKTMENVKNRINLHLTHNEDNAIKWFSKLDFKTSKLIDNLHMIEMYKKEIVYDKPIYVGTSILDLSKLTMMRYHYEVIAKNFNNYQLIYSDTDSLVYNIYCDDIYEWIDNNKSEFDLSEDKYRADNANKKVLGKMKDEMQGAPMKYFTALNPKVYCYECENVDVRKAKGVKKATLKKDIKNSDYNHVLNTGENINKDVYGIRSIGHKVYTLKTNKTCLSPWYDKMNMPDNNNCIPYGHYSLKN